MRWLITGGCGFLGLRLIRNLLNEGGHSVRVFDNLSVGTREDLSGVTEFTESEGHNPIADSGVELVVGDICDAGAALRVAQKADVIIHLAANTGVGPSVENPRADCETNVIGTFNMLEAARSNKAKRFVFASSGAPIGEVEPPIHEELAPHPVSPYGASKLAGEGYCSAYFRSFGVETVALRFGNVYGPGSGHKSSVVAKFIRLAMSGEPWDIWGTGGQTRDFIYVEDLIYALRQASTVEGIGGEAFQIATSRETTVGELADMLSEALVECGVDKPTRSHSEARVGDVLRNFSDTTKARERLGWTAETELRQGLKKTIEWFQSSAA